MAFEVFAPAQAKQAAEERATKDAMRARSIASLTDELLKEKAEAEAAFEEVMATQRKEAAEWFAQTTERKVELATEVAALEKRRAEAVTPLLIKEEDIHSVQEALQARELSVRYKQEQVDEESRLLMRRLDEVSSREQDVQRGEKHLESAKRGVDLQKNQTAAAARLLNEKTAEFQVRVSEQEFEFSRKQSEFDAQDNMHREKSARLRERENELDASTRLLDDQRLLIQKEGERNQQQFASKSAELAAKIDEANHVVRDAHNRREAVRVEERALAEKEASFKERQVEQDEKEQSFATYVAEREADLTRFEAGLDATDKLQKLKEKGYVKREKELENQRIQIADRQLQLDKGFKELRKLTK